MNEEEYQQIIENWKQNNKQLIKSGECIKIFLECLPKWESGKNKGSINWKLSEEYFVYFIYKNQEGWIEIIEYKLNERKLIIQYKNKHYQIPTATFTRCSFGEILGMKTKDFKIKIGQNFKDDKRDLTIIDRKYIKDKNGHNYKYYKYRCNICGFSCSEHYKDGEFQEEYWILESGLLKGNGCSVCCNTPRVVVPHINSIVAKEETHWMIPYFQGGYNEAKMYTVGSNKKLYFKCPECGRKLTKKMGVATVYRQGIRCSCSDGVKYPNKFAFNMLEQSNVNFITEYNPEWIKPKLYDFYFKLNDKEYILEMDGYFHTKDNHLSGQTAKESKVIDDYKDEQAKLHGIEVIRIDCDYDNMEHRFEYIKYNILNNKELNELFNISIVNFDECNKFALSNLVKTACEFKKSNSDLTTTDIGNLMRYNPGTIRDWLKQGMEVGWCNYNAEEELRKIRNQGETLRKSVEIFKEGVSLGIFESAHNLDRKSLELFGIKLDYRSICAVCTGTLKQHKGFTFKYIIQEQYEKRKNEENLKQVI